MHYTCIACRNHPQVFLEKCKYRTKNKYQISRFINTELKSDSDSESSDSYSDSDLDLCFSSSVNYNYILKCIF